MNKEQTPHSTPAKPTDALGTLRARSQLSRVVLVIGAVVIVIVIAFMIGLLWRSVSSGVKNAPTIPQVEV